MATVLFGGAAFCSLVFVVAAFALMDIFRDRDLDDECTEELEQLRRAA